MFGESLMVGSRSYASSKNAYSERSVMSNDGGYIVRWEQTAGNATHQSLLVEATDVRRPAGSEPDAF